jgi:hypothetical protein
MFTFLKFHMVLSASPIELYNICLSATKLQVICAQGNQQIIMNVADCVKYNNLESLLGNP